MLWVAGGLWGGVARAALPSVETAPLRTLGHGTLEAAALSPDGTRAATAGARGVFLWDSDTGALLRALVEGGTAGPYTKLAWSGDGNRLAAAGSVAVAVYDAETGALLFSVERPDAPPTAIALAADGRHLAIGTKTGLVELFDLESGARLFVLDPAALDAVGMGVAALAFDPGGKHLLTATASAHLWNIESGDLDHSIPYTPESGISSAGYSANGDQVLLCAGAEVRVWDKDALDDLPAATLQTSDGRPLGAMAASDDAARVLLVAADPAPYALADPQLLLWDRETSAVAKLHAHRGVVHSLGITPDGRRALSAANDAVVCLWNPETGSLLRELGDHSAPVLRARYAPGANPELLTLHELDLAAHVVDAWDRASGLRTRRVATSFFPYSDFAHSPDGHYLLVANTQGLTLTDLVTTAPQLTLTYSKAAFRAVAWSPTSRVFGAAAGTAALLFDVRTGRQTATLTSFTVGEITDLEFMPDGQHVILGQSTGFAFINETVTGFSIVALGGHSQGLNEIAITRDGQRLATASRDGTARVWRLNSTGILRTFQAPGGARAFAFSPDGARCALGIGNRVDLYDSRSGWLLRTFAAHTDTVTSVVFDESGEHVLTGSADGTAMIWDARNTQLDGMLWVTR